MASVIAYRHNVLNVESIDAFLSIKGGFNGGRRDVYFVRLLGVMPGINEKIADIDRKMDVEVRNKRLCYRRIKHMPVMKSADEIELYSGIYDKWKNNKSLYLKNNNSPLFSEVLSDAVSTVTEDYRKIKPSVNESIEKNFVTKMLFWTDAILGEDLKDWNERKCFKVIVENMTKEQDYLFCLLLTLIGCDVLMLQFASDITIAEDIKNKSVAVTAGPYGTADIPEYRYTEEAPAAKVQMPERPVVKSRTSENYEPKAQVNISGSVAAVPAGRPADTEKSFEELAKLASSVVMITVLNRRGEPEATGSGIMIGRNGYILTNNHVIEDGAIFAVQIEDDDNVYPADGVMKVNQSLDLAIIRIQKKLNPIPIYNDAAKLVRGQKVVAIGSPLGLFNSVSDGIISGFRKIKDRNMIQFTAPISHGSSGGAVLNMQGQIIGISTAGIDEGQNLNLAVSYEDILGFARGFY